jgi:hypothetical protein
MAYSICTVQPAINFLPSASKCMLVFSLEMCALALQKWPLSQTQISTLLLSQKCFIYPRMGVPSYPSRPHEGI